MQRDERFDKAEKIIQVGFWVNAVLMVMKLAAGYWGRSDAVFADGIESACDFIAIGSTMIALKLGRQPYDEQHPYGHGGRIFGCPADFTGNLCNRYLDLC